MLKSKKNVPAVTSDGFSDVDDEGFDSLIENPPKVKFTNDAKWVRGDTVISPNREFLVINILRAVQHWIDQLPTDKSYVLKPDERWPDVDALNAAAPPEEWRDHFGKRVGPWQKAYVVYLLDPQTLEVFTYPTPTAGGFRAVRELKKSTDRARLLRGAVVPLVRLSDTYFPTDYGGRQRPHFHIVGYQPFGPEKSMPAQIEHHDDHSERGDQERDQRDQAPPDSGAHKAKSKSKDVDDDIPW